MDRVAFQAALMAGDQDAWREFTLEFAPLIHSIATRVGLSPEDRQDVLQKVYLVAVQHIQTLRDPTKLAAWVYGIARRVSIDALRAAPREIAVEDLGAVAAANRSLAPEPDVLERLDHLRRVALLLDALARIDERCRRLLIALYFEEPPATYEQIREREGMPIGSIGPTRGRCLEKLVRSYAEVSPPPSDPTSESSPRATRGWSRSAVTTTRE